MRDWRNQLQLNGGIVEEFLLRRGYVIKKTASASDIKNFVDRFKQHYVSVDLVRVGGDNDGGYLLPDVLGTVSHCFSPGVSLTATFEKDLSERYGIKSFMADASVSEAPIKDKNFTFIRKFLGNQDKNDFITLSSWMESSLDGTEEDLILQMDIEGGEYDVLTFESADVLKRFISVTVEFHAMHNIFERHFLQMLTSIFEKLYLDFFICHAHPNNCTGTLTLDGIEVPRIVEFTFIRNDILEDVRKDSSVRLPHPLDQKNVPGRPDLLMPEVWWK